MYPLRVASHTPPGLYTIEFGVYRYLKGDFQFLPITTVEGFEPARHLSLGQVRILDPARARPPETPLVADLGEQVRLIGFDLSEQCLSPDRPLELTLHWQAINQPTANYTVFTHLIGPDNQIWGQQDNQPQQGRYPTTAWKQNDSVVDRYSLSLRDGAPPGQYQLWIGMYNLETGQRLQVVDEMGDRFPNDVILLAELRYLRNED
jgi:hypothetical protein